jgi:hypothetical protein
MGKRIERNPEQEARWSELQQRMQERIAYHERKIREQHDREARRQARLRRLTFGLLPR